MMLTSRVCMLVAQLCSTLCDPMDYSSPGSSVHGILQARILEWVAMPFSRGSIQPRDGTQVSHIAGRFFIILYHSYHSLPFLSFFTREAPGYVYLTTKKKQKKKTCNHKYSTFLSSFYVSLPIKLST